MRTLILLALAVTAACTTQRIYPDPGSSPEAGAIVRADPAFSAGLPVQVRLRMAGDRRISLGASAIELPPGRHSLLVDCRVLESGVTRRFVVEADLEAGREYRLVARASSRNCDAVELIEQ
ncbi:MAG: hypothetical protein HW417_1652 [Steroidobacteraceae bacterium]|nr:hypothetical protein [Steroidobacteraceae bacterium]MBM2854724.1 hypothetical protein [Steroidobacteraceae bacterium]